MDVHELALAVHYVFGCLPQLFVSGDIDHVHFALEGCLLALANLLGLACAFVLLVGFAIMVILDWNLILHVLRGDEVMWSRRHLTSLLMQPKLQSPNEMCL